MTKPECLCDDKKGGHAIDCDFYVKPAWIEEFYEKFPPLLDRSIYGRAVSTIFLRLSDNQRMMIKEFISETLASELQAVLGEEKTALDFEPENPSIEDDNMADGWNAHRQEVIKRAKERGINL